MESILKGFVKNRRPGGFIYETSRYFRNNQIPDSFVDFTLDPSPSDKANTFRDSFLTYLHALRENCWWSFCIPNPILNRLNFKAYPLPLLYSSLLAIPGVIQNNFLDFFGAKLPFPKSSKMLYTYRYLVQETLLSHLLSISPENLKDGFWAVCLEGPYEYGPVALRSGDFVIDAGAFVGDFAALASFKGCQTHAFEIVPHLINEYLSVTAKINGNIIVAPYALCNKEGHMTIHLKDEQGLGTSLCHTDNGPSLEIEMTCLDTYVHRTNMPRVDFIKADIEGAERDMLAGAQSVLRDFAPRLALCTYHLPDDPQVMRDLILSANPRYVIDQKPMKLYAHVPE